MIFVIIFFYKISKSIPDLDTFQQMQHSPLLPLILSFFSIQHFLSFYYDFLQEKRDKGGEL